MGKAFGPDFRSDFFLGQKNVRTKAQVKVYGDDFTFFCYVFAAFYMGFSLALAAKTSAKTKSG